VLVAIHVLRYSYAHPGSASAVKLKAVFLLMAVQKQQVIKKPLELKTK